MFAWAAAAIAVVFSLLLVRQFVRLRRPYQAVWAVALLMFCAASAALATGSSSGWSPRLYRSYWLLGAVLNVPFLAQGEVYLLIARTEIARALMIVLAVASIFAAVVVWTSPMHTAALLQDLPTGKQVWGAGSFTLHLAQYYAYPTYFFLLAGTLWSARKMRGAPALRNRFFGTLAIATGATVVAAGAGFAATGILTGLSLTLVSGIAIMFWGFLRASRPGSTAAPADAEAPP